jgi:hypothetical protein
MNGRNFPFETIQADGRTVTAMRIECADCEAKAYFAQTGHGRKPPIAAEQYFRRHGWHVGNGPRADKCASCQEERKPQLKVVKMDPKAEPKAEKPREMSREDRRIVFAKVDELYLDDKTGYQPPWTDAAVARDLGVPRSWVSAVRDELFGPEGSNAEFDEFLEKAAPIIAETKNLVRSAQVQLEECRRLDARIVELERVAKRIDRDIGKSA